MDRHYNVGADALGLAAPDAAPLTDECPGDGRGILLETHGTVDAALCADEDARRKAEKADATMIATAALAGIELVKLADGSWLACKWGMFKPLATAQEAEAWLVRVTGRPS